MKDRFKFRAWDKDNKVMIDNLQDVYDGGNFDYDAMKRDYLGWARCFGDIINDDRYIIMQYTGLKDKNGKLIYEGDICSHKYHSNPVVITFENGSFVAGDVSIYSESLEIIGDVHQNPELIKGE